MIGGGIAVVVTVIVLIVVIASGSSCKVVVYTDETNGLPKELADGVKPENVKSVSKDKIKVGFEGYFIGTQLDKDNKTNKFFVKSEISGAKADDQSITIEGTCIKSLELKFDATNNKGLASGKLTINAKGLNDDKDLECQLNPAKDYVSYEKDKVFQCAKTVTMDCCGSIDGSGCKDKKGALVVNDLFFGKGDDLSKIKFETDDKANNNCPTKTQSASQPQPTNQISSTTPKSG